MHDIPAFNLSVLLQVYDDVFRFCTTDIAPFGSDIPVIGIFGFLRIIDLSGAFHDRLSGKKILPRPCRLADFRLRKTDSEKVACRYGKIVIVGCHRSGEDNYLRIVRKDKCPGPFRYVKTYTEHIGIFIRKVGILDHTVPVSPHVCDLRRFEIAFGMPFMAPLSYESAVIRHHGLVLCPVYIERAFRITGCRSSQDIKAVVAA